MSDPPPPKTARRWFSAVFSDKELVSVGYAQRLYQSPEWIRVMYTIELACIFALVYYAWKISGQLTTLISQLSAG